MRTALSAHTPGLNCQDGDSDTSHPAASHFSFFVSEFFRASARNIKGGLSSALY